MHPIQLLLICFAAVGIARGLRRFRRGRLSFVPLAGWVLLWCLVSVVAVMPDTTSVVARWLGVGRGADFAMYLAILALFALLFRLFGKIEDVERQLTRVVRALALKDLDGRIPVDDSSSKTQPAEEPSSRADERSSGSA